MVIQFSLHGILVLLWIDNAFQLCVISTFHKPTPTFWAKISPLGAPLIASLQPNTSSLDTVCCHLCFNQFSSHLSFSTNPSFPYLSRHFLTRCQNNCFAEIQNTVFPLSRENSHLKESYYVSLAWPDYDQTRLKMAFSIFLLIFILSYKICSTDLHVAAN